ncbi:hypothetical protein [Flaviflexus sp.]|uniref:hypothetical protein n=1 Tax=Flaviflexus sp. TaxID=1969482 RepID=UPI003F9189EB
MTKIAPILAVSLLLLSACQDSDPDSSTGSTDPTGSTTTSSEGTVATWILVSQDLTSESTTFDIGVMRVECAGGETGTVLDPAIDYEDGRILIEARVETLTDGEYTCQGNNVVPLTIELDEPIGERSLVDGVCHVPGGGIGGDCEGDGVRWPIP